MEDDRLRIPKQAKEGIQTSIALKINQYPNLLESTVLASIAALLSFQMPPAAACRSGTEFQGFLNYPRLY